MSLFGIGTRYYRPYSSKQNIRWSSYKKTWLKKRWKRIIASYHRTGGVW